MVMNVRVQVFLLDFFYYMYFIKYLLIYLSHLLGHLRHRYVGTLICTDINTTIRVPIR